MTKLGNRISSEERGREDQEEDGRDHPRVGDVTRRCQQEQRPAPELFQASSTKVTTYFEVKSELATFVH